MNDNIKTEYLELYNQLYNAAVGIRQFPAIGYLTQQRNIMILQFIRQNESSIKRLGSLHRRVFNG